MNKELIRVALRQQALYLPSSQQSTAATPHALGITAELRKMGFTVSEQLLHALNALTPDEQHEVVSVLSDVTGTQLNWASLVRGWQVPTAETAADHFITMLANIVKDDVTIAGTTLPCGHLIPDGTFPLNRYNGCPFCGKPFVALPGQVYTGQGSKLKELQLWGDTELDTHFRHLLTSAAPLNASQKDSLSILLANRTMPEVSITMKETRMLVIAQLVDLQRDDEAATLMTSPADIMRFLWYRHTGQLQLIEPRTLIHIHEKNNRHRAGNRPTVDNDYRRSLRLKYDRPWCRRVARWLNQLSMPVSTQLEVMHPKRRMWVRFVRALRLDEYSHKKGFGQLHELLTRFHNKDYSSWAGQTDQERLAFPPLSTGGSADAAAQSALRLLQQRPGHFARSLFATMLRLGPERTLEAFSTVADQVASRLLLALGSQAELYFEVGGQRIVRPISGTMKTISTNPLLALYSKARLTAMKTAVNQLYTDSMQRRFSRQPSIGKSIYIDPSLFDIPVGAGDRTATINDTGSALQGTRFRVEGDAVRLFMQWGKGLPAQPLDMDLSCHLLKDDGTTLLCSYFSLNVPGAKHSGDIRQIPDQVGTAEYVELSLPELMANGVRQVAFTCNAYSDGELQPALVVGWMDSRFHMHISEDTGVAYDPSTVSHQIRISQTNLSKGLIFGLLDVTSREITWLEIPFDGQTVLSVSTETINAYMQRLRAKPTIGQLLQLKAKAQQLLITDSAETADEKYTYVWALDTARVNNLLLP